MVTAIVGSEGTDSQATGDGYHGSGTDAGGGCSYAADVLSQNVEGKFVAKQQTQAGGGLCASKIGATKQPRTKSCGHLFPGASVMIADVVGCCLSISRYE